MELQRQTLRLRHTFDLWDSNSDGILTIHDLNQALTSLGLATSLSDLQFVINSHIRPGLTGLQFDDFHTLLSIADVAVDQTIDEEDEDEDEDADLMEVLKVLDENGDGCVSAVELRRMLKAGIG